MNNYNSSRPEMESAAYKSWRFSVFSRDKWTCQMCHKPGKKVEAHHIIKWANNERMRFLTGNGLTLCTDCHAEVTGNEEKYVARFQTIIEQKKFEKSMKLPKKDKFTGNKAKYKPTNPRWFF